MDSSEKAKAQRAKDLVILADYIIATVSQAMLNASERDFDGIYFSVNNEAAMHSETADEVYNHFSSNDLLTCIRSYNVNFQTVSIGWHKKPTKFQMFLYKFGIHDFRMGYAYSQVSISNTIYEWHKRVVVSRKPKPISL